MKGKWDEGKRDKGACAKGQRAKKQGEGGKEQKNKEKGVESLFDFDDIKTLVLLFLIKLLSVSGMSVTHKTKTSLKVLKIQHLGDGFKSHIDKIRISIPKSEQNWKME